MNNYTKEQIEQYKEEIRNLVNSSPKGFQVTMRGKRYKYLMKFIKDMTPLLSDKKYRLPLKIHWVLNDLTDFPKCEYSECCKPLTNICYIHVFDEYPRHCSRKCANNNPLSKARVIATNMIRYHVRNTAQSEQAKTKYRNNMQKKFGPGIINAFQAKEVKEKIKETKLINHGNANFNNREKAEQTCLKEYGVRHTSQIKTVIEKQKKKHIYKYDDLFFDSSWEVAYYIYLKENKIEFQYHPDIKLEYMDCFGKSHYYFPDFKVENKLVEIKGDDQLKNGKMCDKLNSSRDYIAEAKYDCMIRNNVTILTGKDMSKCFELVGKKFHNIKRFFKDIKLK